jgi:hypothetical protein
VSIDGGTAGADVHYTLDGSRPNESSPSYTGSFELTGEVTVRAIAYSSGRVSNVAQAHFQVDRPPRITGVASSPQIALSDTAYLFVSVDHDSLPRGGELSVTWTKVSGPGTVDFGPTVWNARASTSARFSRPGFYQLKPMVSDTATTITGDPVTVRVGPSRAIRDFDGDGRSDVIVQSRDTRATYLWLMDGHKVMRSPRFTRDVESHLRIEGAGDYKGVGTPQILLRDRTSGRVYFRIMEVEKWIADEPSMVIDPRTEIMGSADFDGDGRTDLLVRDRTSADTYFYISNGSTFTPVRWFNLTLNYSFVGTGDFNRDGHSDIILRNLSTGDLFQYLMLRTSLKDWLVWGPTATNYDLAGTGDFNGDEKADVVVRNRDHGHTYFWISDPGSTNVTTHEIGRTDLSYDLICR